ncbi:MAG: hypothetical protein QW156_04500 [Candidatus Aenigmatarchaeota archaeon]
MERYEELEYELRGDVSDSVGAIVYLIMGVGLATLVLIFVGVLGGSIYSQTQSDINAISDIDIKNNITSAIKSGFKSLNLTGGYLPIVVLAVIIFLVLGLVLGLGRGTTTQAGTVL